MKIEILEKDEYDFLNFAQKITGGGFHWKREDESINIIEKLSDEIEARLENWETDPEHISLKIKIKISELKAKEKDKLALKELKKLNKLTPEEKVVLDEMIADLEK